MLDAGAKNFAFILVKRNDTHRVGVRRAMTVADRWREQGMSDETPKPDQKAPAGADRRRAEAEAYPGEDRRKGDRRKSPRA